jgi:hypothetical protein
MGNDDGPMTAHSCFSLRPLPVQKIRDWLLRLGSIRDLYSLRPCIGRKTSADLPALEVAERMLSPVLSQRLRFVAQVIICLDN